MAELDQTRIQRRDFAITVMKLPLEMFWIAFKRRLCTSEFSRCCILWLWL